MYKQKEEIKPNNKILERNRGITLIALVITIIVLIILAGVTIAMLTGENGIIEQTENAKFLTEIGMVKEAVNIKKLENANYNKAHIFGNLGEILGGEYNKYDKKYGIEAGNIVYKSNQFSKKEEEILEENGIERESKYYLIMNETTKQNKYAETENAITLKELQSKITKGEFSGNEGKYNKAYIIEDLDLGATWDENGELISGEVWIPITTIPKNTILDGCDFSIKGLCTDNAKGSQALIATNSGIIKNLTIGKDCWIGGIEMVSSFCSINSSIGKIIKCKNLANINGTDWHCAGICSRNSGIVQECFNYGSFDKKRSVVQVVFVDMVMMVAK